MGRKEDRTATETRRWTSVKNQRGLTLWEQEWGGSRGSDACRGLRQEGGAAGKEAGAKGTQRRAQTLEQTHQEGARRKKGANKHEGGVTDCRVSPRGGWGEWRELIHPGPQH